MLKRLIVVSIVVGLVKVAIAQDIISSQRVNVTNTELNVRGTVSTTVGTVTVSNIDQVRGTVAITNIKEMEGTVTVKNIDQVKGTVAVTNINRRITDGTDILQINPDGSINVHPYPIPERIETRFFAQAVPSGAEVKLGDYTMHSYNGYVQLITVSSAGAGKFTVKTPSVVGDVAAVYFTSPTSPTFAAPFSGYLVVWDATKIEIWARNDEGATTNMYATLSLMLR